MKHEPDLLPVPLLRRRYPDLEVQRLFLQLSPARVLPIGNLSIRSLRRKWQLCVKAFASKESVGEIEERSFVSDGHRIRLRTYTPSRLVGKESRPAMLWIHGGGFVIGDLATAGSTCRKLANQCGCVVIAVEYRLSPEFPLTKGLSDCINAFAWIASHSAELAVDPQRIAVGGDSAGGSLAALVAQQLRRDEGHRPAAQVLVYPATDLRATYPEDHSAPTANRMLGELFRWLQTQIRTSDLRNPRLSPSVADDVSGLAPAIILTAGFDPLRDDGLAYARRLKEQGVSVRLLHFPGQFHGFLSFDAVLHGGELAFRQIGGALRGLFVNGQIDEGVTSTEVNSPRSWGWLWLRPSQRLKELVVVLQIARDELQRLYPSSRLSAS